MIASRAFHVYQSSCGANASKTEIPLRNHNAAGSNYKCPVVSAPDVQHFKAGGPYRLRQRFVADRGEKTLAVPLSRLTFATMLYRAFSVAVTLRRQFSHRITPSFMVGLPMGADSFLALIHGCFSIPQRVLSGEALDE